MLENIPGFDTISDIIRAHHEKWDGTGYPKRLKGQNIPIGARIVAVANYMTATLTPAPSIGKKLTPTLSSSCRIRPVWILSRQ